METSGGITLRWADISIEDGTYFELGLGRHVLDPAVGGDTESQTIFTAGAGGDWEGDIDTWIDEVEALFAYRWDLSFEDDYLDEDLPWDDDRPDN